MRGTQIRVALGVALVLVALTITIGVVIGRSPRAPSPKGPLIPIASNGDWPSYHRDNAHTGYDPTLPAVVSVSTGWTSANLDGQVYASPVVFGGIVYTATLNNTVYALNQADGSTLWSKHLGTPQGAGWRCGNVTPTGILGTPVIDTVAKRVYAVAEIHGATPRYHLFGLDLVTGATLLDQVLSPTGFDWTIEQERGALALANGYVYVPFGGRAGDCFDGNTPYYGWVVGVPTDGISAQKILRTADGGEGIWAAGGIVVDDSSHNVFFATGNAIPCAGTTMSDAVVRVSPTLTSPSVFEPQDWQANWCAPDSDLGSASLVLISPTLAFTAGKHGGGFLVDPTNLGGVNGQLYPSATGYRQADVCLGASSDATFGGFAYAAPFVYLECEGKGLVALKVNTSTPSFSPCHLTCASPDWSAGGGATFGPPIVAAGAVWVVSDGGLSAYKAGDGTLIYQSQAFGVNRFVTPAEAGCRVIVPSLRVIRTFVMHFAPGISGCV
ncbi:MAG TPA: PQQ-binding-like beta-propeller repeat protein [Candidatus Dormibacteraeota bacterium]